MTASYDWRVWRVDEKWKRYGYEEHYLSYRGSQTKYKAIIRRGNLVAIVTRDYVLLPLEASEQIADRISERIGAEKVDCIYTDTKMYALYKLKDVRDIGKYRVCRGFFMYNSIDGSMAFGASVLAEIWIGSNRYYALMGAKAMSRILSPEKAVAVLWKPHRKGVLDADEKELIETVKNVIDRGEEALNVFKVWSELYINDEVARYFADRFPEIYLPRSVKLLSKGYTIKELVTVWDAYVEFVQRIWRNPNASIDRKYELMRLLLSAVENATKKLKG